MKLPTQPITRISIITGMSAFVMECHLDPAGWDELQLEQARKNVASLYEMLHGQPAEVLFDYEAIAMMGDPCGLPLSIARAIPYHDPSDPIRNRPQPR